MTLYHQDAYLKQFDATVLSCDATEGVWAVTLSQTAFYPTGGGQPHDTGILGGARVLDVQKSQGRIVHFLDAPLEVGQTVHGLIDWERRFDHMCQHAADHLIAQALLRAYGAVTIGLHLGAADVSINVDMRGQALRLTRDELDRIEDTVNEQVRADLPIRCWFPDEEEMKALPIRKDTSGIEGDVRIVGMGDYEFVPCGGTHPSSTGQIGLIKILSARPDKGHMRLFFLAGQRALRHFQTVQNEFERACTVLSANEQTLAQHAQQALDAQKRLESELLDCQLRQVMAQKDILIQRARLCAEGNVIFHVFEGAPEKALRELASELIQAPDVIALLFSRDQARLSCVFACGANCAVNMGATMKSFLPRFGGRGGGKPNFASGSLPADTDQDALRAQAMALFM